jgi:hypothetical protein
LEKLAKKRFGARGSKTFLGQLSQIAISEGKTGGAAVLAAAG